jgi:hypothetical protein
VEAQHLRPSDDALDCLHSLRQPEPLIKFLLMHSSKGRTALRAGPHPSGYPCETRLQAVSTVRWRPT